DAALALRDEWLDRKPLLRTRRRTIARFARLAGPGRAAGLPVPLLRPHGAQHASRTIPGAVRGYRRACERRTHPTRLQNLRLVSPRRGLTARLRRLSRCRSFLSVPSRLGERLLGSCRREVPPGARLRTRRQRSRTRRLRVDARRSGAVAVCTLCADGCDAVANRRTRRRAIRREARTCARVLPGKSRGRRARRDAELRDRAADLCLRARRRRFRRIPSRRCPRTLRVRPRRV